VGCLSKPSAEAAVAQNVRSHILLIGAGLSEEFWALTHVAGLRSDGILTAACRWRDPLSRQPEIAASNEKLLRRWYKAGVQSPG